MFISLNSLSAHMAFILWFRAGNKGWKGEDGQTQWRKYHPSSARNWDLFSDVTLGFLPWGWGYHENTHKV